MPKAVMSEQSEAEIIDGRAAEGARVWDDDHPQQPGLASQTILSSGLSSAIANPVTKNAKHRFGLPAGFVSRLNRYGRTVLFEDNVYRLPNGLEFIPRPPSGALGSRNHDYALLTPEQYQEGKRGSVYVRTDGRIFDYAFDHSDTDRDLFDTGFTIHDLERTGRYAPELKSNLMSACKRRQAPKRKKKMRTGKKKTGVGRG